MHPGLRPNEIAAHITIRFDVDSLYYVRDNRILELPLHRELEYYGISLDNLLAVLNACCRGEETDIDHLRFIIGGLISALSLFMRRGEYRMLSRPVAKICEYIHENFSRGDLSIAEIAAAVELSPNYLQKVFRREQGCTPREYLINLRLNTARRLLLRHAGRIKEIAAMCGWNCPHYFANCYRRRFGHYPSQE